MCALNASPATIKDIARRARVSHSTVSRALHGSPLISDETTERIRLIAHEMGYHPNAAARDALYASKITSYAQGLGMLRIASDEYHYDLNPGMIARIWRAGCIIRASLLGDTTIAALDQVKAFAKSGSARKQR